MPSHTALQSTPYGSLAPASSLILGNGEDLLDGYDLDRDALQRLLADTLKWG